MTKEKRFDHQGYLKAKYSFENGEYETTPLEEYMFFIIDGHEKHIVNMNDTINKLTHELELEKEKSEFAKAICFALAGKKTEQ